MSKFIPVVSACYFGFPILFLILSVVVFAVPASKIFSIFLSPLYVFVSVISMAVGIGLWKTHKWAWYGFLFVNLFVIYLSASIIANQGEAQNPAIVFFAICFVILILIYWLRDQLCVPYFLPKIRWWENSMFETFSVPCLVKGTTGAIEGKILDLSLKGCFVKSSDDLKKNESIEIVFSLNGNDYACRGVVVWNARSTVTHPKGLGIKFVPFHRPVRKHLRADIRVIASRSIEESIEDGIISSEP